jgi:pyruvate,water dikinase
MVQSDVSGVLFTGNPLTGALNESVIDATFGLGEALVSGQVEPDHFVVEAGSGVLDRSLGSKQTIVEANKAGGVVTRQIETSTKETLTDAQLAELAGLAQRIESEYGFPQDIEFALAQNKFYILQSRPITSLFPLPENMPSAPLRVLISFGAVQGILDPITPMGRDNFAAVLAGGARLFGFDLTYKTQHTLIFAGERLWIDITAILRNRVGRAVWSVISSMIEPSIGRALNTIVADPEWNHPGHPQPATILRLMRFFVPSLFRARRFMANPEKERARFFVAFEEVFMHYTAMVAAIRAADETRDRYARLAARLPLFEQVYTVFPKIMPIFMPMMMSAMGSFNFANKLASAGEDGFSNEVLAITRGVPFNVTTEMDLSLWETARQIRADSVSLDLFNGSDAPALAARYMNGTLPSAAQLALSGFLSRYGMRGLGEIDLGRLRWHEDPTQLMQVLTSYLAIADESQAPDVVFARGAQVAEESIELIAEKLRRKHGALRARLFKFFASRMRALIGLRESPKFLAIRIMGIARENLLSVGREFEASGEIDQAEDMFFLHWDELYALADNEPTDWKPLVAERRAVYDRELRRRQIPRVLVSDGRAYYEGVGGGNETGDTITGSPVSPGVVEGTVRVVLDPRGVSLQPGEILVCPATDPGWTPLFLSAGGLITEVGGMMTHGSVVAREYGIPAVVGVHQATSRLKTGQRIRVDGSAGKVYLLPNP